MDSRCQQAELIARLREEVAACGRGPAQLRLVTGEIQTDWPELNRILPGGGLRRGSLVEVLDNGGGAGTVAAIFTQALCRSPGVVVVIDRAGEFYPPALTAWGVPLERQVILRPKDDADALWAADQALRSRAAVAVWLWFDRLAPHDFRRLHLSAEEGEAVGILFRQRAAGFIPAVDLQLAVSKKKVSGTISAAEMVPDTFFLQIEVTRCRHGVPGAVAEDLPGGSW